MTTYILDGEKWVVGAPVVGEKFKEVNDKGGELISFYSLPPEPALPTAMTTNSFLLRIDPELAAIDLASIDDPTADTPTRLGKAELRKFMRYVDNATYIDKALPQTINSLATLVSVGLMTAERRDEVLNAPVTEDEVFTGA